MGIAQRSRLIVIHMPARQNDFIYHKYVSTQDSSISLLLAIVSYGRARKNDFFLHQCDDA
jgi:hypothetical protein